MRTFFHPKSGSWIALSIALLTLPMQAAAADFPPDVFVNGFTNLDVLKPVHYSAAHPNKVVTPIMTANDLAKVHALKLEPFRPLYDFNSPPRPQDANEPWLGRDLDVTRMDDAHTLAKILQRYVYEGWFDQDTSPDKSNYNSHFRENAQRSWCQTPWLNVTEAGREAIHGLTEEFPISASPAFRIPKKIDDNGLAVTWGLAFYNRRFCELYNQFFQSGVEIVKGLLNHDLHTRAQDGSVDFKLLFSAMENWPRVMKGQWDGVYNWDVHASSSMPGGGEKSKRRLMNVPHIQMDVGFKDSRIAGTRPELNYWTMMSFYYDPTYRDNELVNEMNIPEPLKHMRPVGLQWGLDLGQSHVFPGSKNNHNPNGVELPDSATRLNGPIDSSQTSCMGCHSQSGISFGLNPKPNGKPVDVPTFGFLTFEEYSHYLSPEMGTGSTFDFNMQLGEAMRNFSKSKLR